MLGEVATKLRETLGDGLFEDHNVFLERVDAALKKLDPRSRRRRPEAHHRCRQLACGERAAGDQKGAQGQDRASRLIRSMAFSRPSSTARLALLNTSPTANSATTEQDPRFLSLAAWKPSSAARCCRIRPALGSSKPTPRSATRVSFTRHFYKPPELRTLAQISADILALKQETEGSLGEITKGAKA